MYTTVTHCLPSGSKSLGLRQVSHCANRNQVISTEVSLLTAVVQWPSAAAMSERHADPGVHTGDLIDAETCQSTSHRLAETPRTSSTLCPSHHHRTQ